MSRAKKTSSASHPASKSVAARLGRSREARRATSPSIDTDKSLKEAPRAASPIPLLSAHTNAGVQKSKKKRQQKSRNQKLRQEKGLARAEAVMDQMEKKVYGLKRKERKRNARKGAWDEINGAGKDDRRKAVRGGADMDVDFDDEWEDEEDELKLAKAGPKKIVDGLVLPAAAAATKLLVVDRTTSGTNDEADNIN